MLGRLAETGLSAREIAERLKKSRNAIIGACYRRGIVLKGKSMGRPRKLKKPQAIRRALASVA